MRQGQRLDADDLRRLPLSDRKAMLRKLLRRSADGIQYVHHAKGNGGELYEAACKLGLEGIVSKRLTAAYKSGPCTQGPQSELAGLPADSRLARSRRTFVVQAKKKDEVHYLGSGNRRRTRRKRCASGEGWDVQLTDHVPDEEYAAFIDIPSRHVRRIEYVNALGFDV